jgi:hypothetical protein
MAEWEASVTFIWEHFFKGCLDDLPGSWGSLLSFDVPEEHRGLLRRRFLDEGFEWYQVYNLVEFVARNADEVLDLPSQQFQAQANEILEQERSGYRFIDGKLVPISGGQEVQSIETSIAMAQESGLFGVQQHLETAIELLAMKPEADYRNSIKESISAIESLARQTTGQESFSRAIAELDARIGFHGGFKSALDKLYGYSSDEDGIRHAILEEKDVGFDEAKFMLVICSALVNFMISKAAKQGLLETDA